MIEKGKYDHLAGMIVEATTADGVLLLIFGGKLGDGTACKMRPEFALHMPALLRKIADEMEEDFSLLPYVLPDVPPAEPPPPAPQAPPASPH